MRQRLQIYPTADPDFNHGHGEQFFRAFDKAFNLQPIIAEVKYDTTNRHISKSEISTNVNAAGTRYISEDMLGKVEGEPNKSPSNIVQEHPGGSIPQPTENDMVGEVSFVEADATRVFPASHASAPFFNGITPHPRCALAQLTIRSRWIEMSS